jgi:hypothetical protein
MSLNKFNPRSAVLFAFMLIAAALRILFSQGHSPLINFTPIGAMAMFGGAYFSKTWKALLFPIITLWLGDLVLNRLVYYHEWRLFYTGWFWTYLAFALIALAGGWIIKKVSVKNIVIGCLAATLIHWIGTSPGCIMIEPSMYPRSLAGYFTSLVAAIPYEGDFLVGSLIYSGILFGLFELLQQRYISLQTIKAGA